jgi:large subunit ribosomal protein L35
MSAVMPKQKTHKGTKKRFRVTAKGKVKHRSAGTSHLAQRKSHKRRRMLRGTTTVETVEAKRVIVVLGKYSY